MDRTVDELLLLLLQQYESELFGTPIVGGGTNRTFARETSGRGELWGLVLSASPLQKSQGTRSKERPVKAGGVCVCVRLWVSVPAAVGILRVFHLQTWSVRGSPAGSAAGRCGRHDSRARPVLRIPDHESYRRTFPAISVSHFSLSRATAAAVAGLSIGPLQHSVTSVHGHTTPDRIQCR